MKHQNGNTLQTSEQIKLEDVLSKNLKNRRRRHFRDDFKRYILAEIEKGAMNIKRVVDPNSGKEIPELLIQRWKDQFRTEGFQAQKVRSASFSIDMISLEEAFSIIGKLKVENEKLASLCKNLL